MILLITAKNFTHLMYNRADLIYGQRPVTSLPCVFMQTQVQDLKFQTNKPFMSERAIPPHQITFVWIQSLKIFENFNLWMIWKVKVQMKWKISFKPFLITSPVILCIYLTILTKKQLKKQHLLVFLYQNWPKVSCKVCQWCLHQLVLTNFNQ